MTQVLSISATTAAYAMEAVKPARRIATKDQVKDVKADAEANDARASGANKPEKIIVSPPTVLKLELGIGGIKENSTSAQDASKAYRDV